MQRDTFVRRWLVPPREAPAEVALRRILPDVRIASATLDEAVAELARLGGVPIRVSPGAYAARGPYEPPPIDLRLRNVTLAEALTALLAVEPRGASGALLAIPVGSEVVVLTPAEARRCRTMRVYGMAELLPPSGPSRAIPEGGSGRDDQVDAESDRIALAFDVQRLVNTALAEHGGSPWTLAGDRNPGGGWSQDVETQLFGDSLIVVALAGDQDRVLPLFGAVRRHGGCGPDPRIDR